MNQVPQLLLESVIIEHEMIGKFSISLYEKIYKVCSHCAEDFQQYAETRHDASHDWHNESAFGVDTWIPLANEFFEFSSLMATIQETLPRAKNEFETVKRLAVALQNN